MISIHIDTNRQDLAYTAYLPHAPEVEFVWEGEFTRPLIRAVLKDQEQPQARVCMEGSYVGVFDYKNGWVN